MLQGDVRTIEPEWWRIHLCSPYWRIYLNDGPGAWIQHPAGRCDLVPGRIYVLPAWGDFDGRCSTAVRHNFLHVDPGEPLRDIARGGDPLGACFRRPMALPADGGLAQQMRGLFADGARSRLWTLRAQAVAMRVVMRCLEQCPADGLAAYERQAADDGFIARVHLFMDDHLHKPLSVRFIARHFRMSESHFCRRFRRDSGTSPLVCLQQRRIASAQERLITSDDPIEVIAEKCGFANRYHFSRVFARISGAAPGRFRLRSRR